MRGWFSSWRRAGYYSLGVIALLVIAASIFFGTDLTGKRGAAEKAAPVVTQKEPSSAEELAAKKRAEEEAAERAAAERAAAERAKEEEAKEEEARRLAEEKAAAERAAADQYAAEWAAIQQAAAEQAAADQYAAEQAALAAERAATEQALVTPSLTTMFLTIPALGLYDIPVVDDTSEAGLSQGASHLPGTGFPWITGSNTYIAGHRIGYPGTPSDHVFYNLPSLAAGDQVILTDANGISYTYAVSEVFAVTPYDLWVTSPVAGRDMVSLQVCTETPNDWWTIGPNLMSSGPASGRLIVRADRVA